MTFGNLDAFIHSDLFKSFSFLPINPFRSLTHANNPRSKGVESALFLAMDGEILIG